MRRKRLNAMVLFSILALQACVGPGGVNTTATRSVALEAARRTGTVTLAARLAITPHRGLMALVNPWAATDIDHVQLELFQGATSKGTLTVTQGQLGGVVRINNLAPNTSYTIHARAWQDAGETLPIDNFDLSAPTCTTSFSTTSEDVLSLGGGIALRLRDRTFSGLGTGAIAVTSGSLVTSGVEALALLFNTGVVSTLAGSILGYADGTGATAQFNYPRGVAVDAAGNVYVSDYSNQRIRKVSPTGVVTTLAGSTAGNADGTGAAAQFDGPAGITVDAAGNVYVADSNNSRIRKVSPAGVVTTLAGSTVGYTDGTGAAAQFNYPFCVAVDAAGYVYVGDSYNCRIRKVSPAGVVTTMAGGTSGYADGTGAAAQFNFPSGVAVDAVGNVYVADHSNNCIRKVSPTGVVTTLAGGTQGYADGTGAAAKFYNPWGVTVDAGGYVYVADHNNSCIRKVSPGGVVTTLAGGTPGYSDGTGAAAQLYIPMAVTVDASGKLFVADWGNHRIRKIQ